MRARLVVGAALALLNASAALAQTAPPWGPNDSPTMQNWLAFWATKLNVISAAQAQTAPPWGPDASPTLANWLAFWATKQDVSKSAPSAGQVITLYVDSVNGKDANSGATAALALKNLTAVTPAAGMQIGLACGSHWRQSLVSANLNNVGYIGYPLGCSNPPIIDASDLIPNANFTLDSGASYQATVSYTLPTGNNNQVFLATEIGAPGDNPNGQMLILATSHANEISTACSFFLNGWSGMGNDLPASGATLFVHPCDGSSAITNGYTYAFTSRAHAWSLTAGWSDQVINVEARYSGNNDGPCQGGAPTTGTYQGGNGLYMSNDICRFGSKHLSVVPYGSLTVNNKFIDCYFGAAGGCTFITYFDNTPSNASISVGGNIFQQDQLVAGMSGGTAIISHTGSGTGTTSPVVLQNNWYIGKNGASMGVMDVQNVGPTTETGDQGSEIAAIDNDLQNNYTGYGNHFVTDITNNQAFQFTSSGLTFHSTQNQICVSNAQNGIVFMQQPSTTVTSDGDTFYILAGSSNNVFFNFNTAASVSLAFNNDIFGGGINIFPVGQFSASAWTFTGGDSAGTANTYPATANWAWGNVNKTTLAAWQTASGHDASAVQATAGSSACSITVPNVL